MEYKPALQVVIGSIDPVSKEINSRLMLHFHSFYWSGVFLLLQRFLICWGQSQKSDMNQNKMLAWQLSNGNITQH